MTRAPLLRRELNLRMREWNAFWIPFVYVGTLCLVCGNAYLAAGASETEPWRLGRELFSLLSWTSLVLLALAVPVFAAGSITVEREQRTLESLLMTSLSPRAIVLGKLAAVVAYGFLLMSTSLPLLAVASALGGVDFPTLALHYSSLGGAALALAAFGLSVSARFKRSAYAIALCYGLLALVVGLTLSAVAILAQVEAILQERLLRHVAFLNPLFFLDEHVRWQWPLSVLWFLALAVACAEAAVARLAREGRP